MPRNGPSSMMAGLFDLARASVGPGIKGTLFRQPKNITVCGHRLVPVDLRAGAWTSTPRWYFLPIVLPVTAGLGLSYRPLLWITPLFVGRPWYRRCGAPVAQLFIRRARRCTSDMSEILPDRTTPASMQAGPRSKQVI